MSDSSATFPKRDTPVPSDRFDVGHHTLLITDAAHMLHNVELLVRSLLDLKPAFAVIPVSDDDFMQVMALPDDSLRLESSASADVLVAKLGFDELVEQFPDIAAATIPPHWHAREMITAETLMRLIVDVHGVLFPALLEFRVSPVS